MVRSITPIAFVLVLLMSIADEAFGQELASRANTEQELSRLHEQIAEDMERLATTEEREKASRRQLSSLNRQIDLREKLLVTYTRRIDEMRSDRDSLETSIESLESRVKILQSEYQARARHAYKYGRLHDIALILSAESINQMLIRIGYLRRFTDQRRLQLTAIEQSSESLSSKRTKLHHMLVQTEMLKRQASNEQEELAALKRERQQEIDRLKKAQVDISEELEQKRTMAQALSDRINAIIAEETRRKRALRTVPAAALEPVKRSTSDFAGGRGRLPWPSEGTIEFPFGEIIHPEYGTVTPNPGILIGTRPAADVNAVFGGVISTIDIMPDLGRYIIVDHGDYHTVYGNFSLLYVGRGDKIESGQLIGRAGTENEPKGEGVFFAVFKDGVPVDPEKWLTSRSDTRAAATR